MPALPIDINTLLIFLPVVIVLVTTPGPNTLFLVATGLRHGPLASAYAAAGISLATGCHILLTATGVSSLISASSLAFNTIRVAGVAYLLWLAYDNLHNDRHSRVQVQQGMRAGEQLRNGFITNLINPKSNVFCALFLPQFVVPDQGRIFFQILTLGFCLVVVGFCSDMIFAVGSGKLARWIKDHAGFLAMQRWLLSTVFLALAVWLLTLDQVSGQTPMSATP